jgi:hypothetical protein
VDALGARTAMPLVTSVDATACDYTTSHLRADFSVAGGHHVEVVCL